MDLKYLTNKTIDGTKYILAQPTMMFKRKDEIIIIANHIVKDDEAGRPDLIALEHYNDDSMTDIILKFNGISDPFSLMPGEELQIPIDTVPYYKLERPGIFEDNPIKNEFIQGKKFSQKDRNRIEALKKNINLHFYQQFQNSFYVFAISLSTQMLDCLYNPRTYGELLSLLMQLFQQHNLRPDHRLFYAIQIILFYYERIIL